MPFDKQYNSASTYAPTKDKQTLKVPMLSGSLILIFAFKYLATSFFALGSGESFYFLFSMLVFSLMLGSFILLRKGIALELIYKKSKYAKHSKIPYKTLGAVLVTIAISLSSYLGEYGLFASLMLGVASLAGYYMYYGFDPHVDKIDAYQSDKSAQRIMALLSKANEDIQAIQEYAQNLKSQTIAHLMQEMSEEFSKVVKHIEEDPNDYDKARKYLVSYLGELKDMSETFMKLDAKDKAQDIKLAFEETLKESINKLQKQYEKLMDDDILDLDIKLSVMKKRFKNED